jgi:O-antigen/teichoic acid export membrane protein
MVWVVAVAVSLASNLLLVPFMHLKGAAITAAATSLISTWLLMWLTHRAGLRLDRSAWLATALPLILLLPPSIMLLGLALAAIATVRTDWLLTPLDRERIDGALQHLLVWRVSRAWQTMAR